MASRFLISHIPTVTGMPPPENVVLKIKANEEHKKQKQAALKAEKIQRAKDRNALKLRTFTYEAEYRKREKALVRLRREAKAKNGFFRENDPRLVFVVRIRGINKIPPKPKMILRLFRLRQINNGVFIKVNKATIEMLKAVQPYVTYGYPSLSTVRRLIYKRGFGKVVVNGAKMRIKLTDNAIIKKAFSKVNVGRAKSSVGTKRSRPIEGIEDIVHEIYTVGPNFKKCANFLWPIKLSNPRGGFVCKRHGFSEARGGDWGNREELINDLVRKMN